MSFSLYLLALPDSIICQLVFSDVHSIVSPLLSATIYQLVLAIPNSWFWKNLQFTGSSWAMREQHLQFTGHSCYYYLHSSLQGLLLKGACLLLLIYSSMILLGRLNRNWELWGSWSRIVWKTSKTGPRGWKPSKCSRVLPFFEKSYYLQLFFRNTMGGVRRNSWWKLSAQYNLLLPVETREPVNWRDSFSIFSWTFHRPHRATLNLR